MKLLLLRARSLSLSVDDFPEPFWGGRLQELQHELNSVAIRKGLRQAAPPPGLPKRRVRPALEYPGLAPSPRSLA